jgi:hypothetical protein
MSAFDSTGAAFGRNGRTYARALESSLRIIAAAEHGKELVVFANQARELAHHVRAGGLELLPVVKHLLKDYERKVGNADRSSDNEGEPSLVGLKRETRRLLLRRKLRRHG